MSFCTQCGQKSEGNKYCVACGQLVSHVPYDAAKPAVAEPLLPGVFPLTPSEQFASNTNPPPAPGTRNRTVLLSSAGAILAIVAVFLIWPKPSPATETLSELCTVMTNERFEEISWIDSSELGDEAEALMREANNLDRETSQPLNALMREYSQWVDDTGDLIIDIAFASAQDDWSEVLEIADRAGEQSDIAAGLTRDFREACVPFN